MSPSAPTSGAPPLSRAVILCVLAASLMVGAFAISTQSYWIDEATSLIVAMAPNPSEAWRYAQAVGGSTIQMPVYHVYLYAWHKIFGSGEWTMRASNLPWFILGQAAFLILLRDKPRLALIATILAAVSPTVWMYLDEARPYLVQYAAACWLMAAIVRASLPDTPPATRHPLLMTAALGTAALILFGSSLLGVLWVGGFVAALAWLHFSDQALQTQNKATKALPSNRQGLLLLLFVAAAIALVVYYTWTWSNAGRGYHLGGTSLVSLPYIAYEFLGFAGYGPGKLQLRTSVVAPLAENIPNLVPLALIVGMLAIFLILQPGIRKTPSRTIVAWLLALAVPSLIILGGFFLASYRPLPRHFIPALPAVVLAFAAIMDAALAQKRLVWRAAAILLPFLWLGSALSLRWREIHAKDDYRTAARIAAEALAENKEVWWGADAAAAYIYLTPVALTEAPGRAWAMQAPSWDAIRFKFPPRLIVISKPDIYDPQGSIARYAAENHFVPALQLQAFTILTREGDRLPGITP